MPIREKFIAAKSWYLTHERKILYTALALSATAAVMMRGGLAEHDQFLKANDLYETYYNAID